MALGSAPQQSVSVAATSTSPATVTIASAPAGSVLVWAWGIVGGSGGQVATPSSPNTTWTAIYQGTVNGNYMEVWFGVVAGGASGTTVTLTSALGSFATVGCRGWLEEWRGSNGVAYALATNSGTGTAMDLPTLTPVSGKNSAIVGLVRSSVAQTWGAVSGGFTDTTVSGSSAGRGIYRVDASAPGTALTGSIAGSASNTWSTVAFILYDTAPPGSAPNPSRSVAQLTAVVGAWAPPFAMSLAPSQIDRMAALLPAAATVITTQPAASVVTGNALTIVAKATSDGSTIDTSYTGPATLTLIKQNGSGSLTGTTTIANCTAGVATFNAAVPNGDGSGYQYVVTMTGMTPATSTAFTIIGPYTAQVQALVSTVGGDAALFTYWDPRVYANGTYSSIPDVVGPISGRAAGVTLLQASGANQPPVASGKFTFTAASQQWFQSAQDARLVLDASTPLYLVIWGELTNDGYLGAIAKDPTDSSQAPYVALQSASGTYAADFLATGSGAGVRVQPSSNVARSGGVSRTQVFGKASRLGNANIDEIYRYSLAGRPARRHHIVAVATTVTGGLKAALGRLGTVYASGSIAGAALFAGDLTATVLSAFQTHGTALGCTPDSTITKRWGADGNSRTRGSTSTDPLNPAEVSGTTTWPYLVLTDSSGRGTLVSQGVEPNIHGVNFGASGRNLQELIDTFPYEAGLLYDGSTSIHVHTVEEIGNYVQGTGASAATTLAKLAELKALHDARGGKMIVCTQPSIGVGANGSNGNNTGCYIDGVSSTLSVYGTTIAAVNAAVRASWWLYGHYPPIDFEADSRMSIATRACDNTTYFSDKSHNTDAGNVVKAGIAKAYFTANDVIFWPVPLTGPMATAEMDQVRRTWLETPRPAVRRAMAVMGSTGLTASSTQPLVLGGSATATVAVAATSAVALPLAGSSTATVSESATSSLALSLAGSSSAAVTDAVTSSLALPLGGSATATTAESATSSVTLPLSGSATGTVSNVATTTRALPLGGSATAVVGSVPISADSALAVPLGGSSAAIVLVTGAVAGLVPLVGTATATLAITATSSRGLPLSGSAAAAHGLLATSTDVVRLGGTATAIVTAPGSSQTDAYEGITRTVPALSGSVTTRPKYSGTVLTFPA